MWHAYLAGCQFHTSCSKYALELFHLLLPACWPVCTAGRFCIWFVITLYFFHCFQVGTKSNTATATKRATSNNASTALARKHAPNMPQFILDALSDDGPNQGPCQQASLGELVRCLVQLDGVDEAKAYLSLHSRAEIRRMILEVVEHWATTHQQTMMIDGSSSSLTAAGEWYRERNALVE